MRPANRASSPWRNLTRLDSRQLSPYPYPPLADFPVRLPRPLLTLALLFIHNDPTRRQSLGAWASTDSSPGFGLMVPPALHRVFTSCGIRDASATIEGSRNPVEVVKCAIQILHGGVSDETRSGLGPPHCFFC